MKMNAEKKMKTNVFYNLQNVYQFQGKSFLKNAIKKMLIKLFLNIFLKILKTFNAKKYL